SKSDQFNPISKGIIDNAALNKNSFRSIYNQTAKNDKKTLFHCRSNNNNSLDYLCQNFETNKIIERVNSHSIRHHYQFYNSSSIIENIYSYLAFEFQSLRTKMNDTSSLLKNTLLQVREVNSDNEEQAQSLEYQTINSKKSELNNRKNIDIYKKDSLIPNCEVVAINADDENYIFYKEEKYTIDEFLESQQKEIESLYNDNHLLNDYLSHKYENIHEDILALQKDIDNLENWHLRGEFGEY
ncbi:17306_t:CDS:1, partial [Gigaspora margarita]